VYSFLPFHQGSPFRVRNREIKKEIKYENKNVITNLHIEKSQGNLTQSIQNEQIINSLSGFYGLIGPDIDRFSIKTLYDLFTGDGIIQGIFFNNGNITFVKHVVRTEKIIYEEQYGRFSKKILMMAFYIFMNKMGMLPNVLGLANTALLQTGNKTLALFERDVPYEINVNFAEKQLSTMKKMIIPGLHHFSGHSKYNNLTNEIHTIDYDIITNTVSYITLDSNFKQSKRVLIKTIYIPIIHDFVVLKNGFLLIDSPFIWNPLSKIPVSFSKKPTYIHIYNKHTNARMQYESQESFYIFHYADVIENLHNTSGKVSSIDIYGSLYDSVDFSSLNIQGKYRKITVDIETGKVYIKKNPDFENMNLDFPMKWKEYVLLRSIENQTINGFVLCKELVMIKKLQLPENRFFCGEPSIVEIAGSPFLLGFSYDSFDNGYFTLLEFFSDKYIEIPLGDIRPTIGFHSIFLGGSSLTSGNNCSCGEGTGCSCGEGTGCSCGEGTGCSCDNSLSC
jgi:carotenoid cleavage dioxygenase-like enzyme